MKTAVDKQYSLKTAFLSGTAIFFALMLFSVFPAKAFAGLILDAELRFTYEDNIVGLLSGQQGAGQASGGGMLHPGGAMGGPNSNPQNSMGGPHPGVYTGSASASDFYSTVSAEAGGFTDVGDSLSVFAKGFADRSDYNTYTELNSMIGGASAGAVVSLGHGVTMLGTVVGKIKEFGDHDRNSTAWGGTLSLKEKLAKDVWVREFGEYELNSATTDTFSYGGTKIGVSGGFDLTPRTSAAIGYSYLLQKYDDPSNTVWRTHTVFVSAEQKFGEAWSVGAEYDLQLSRDSTTNAGTTDNIYSLALRYSY